MAHWDKNDVSVPRLLCDWKPFKSNLTFESATYACWASRPFCLLKNLQIFVVSTLIKYCSCCINYRELNCRIMQLTFLKFEAFWIQLDIWKSNLCLLHFKHPSAYWKTNWDKHFKILCLCLVYFVIGSLLNPIWNLKVQPTPAEQQAPSAYWKTSKYLSFLCLSDTVAAVLTTAS